MTNQYRSVLDDLRVQLVNDLNPEDVLDYLIQDNILVPDDTETIDSKASRKEKVRCLLDLIKRRGNRALESFIKALADQNSGHRHLHEMITKRMVQQPQDTLPQNIPVEQKPYSFQRPMQCTESTKDSTDSKPCYSGQRRVNSTAKGVDFPGDFGPDPSNSNAVVTEKQLSELAQKLGGNWEQVAITLGLTKNDVYRCMAENQLSVWGQIHSALIKWRNSTYPLATIGNLVAALRANQVSREVYEFLM